MAQNEELYNAILKGKRKIVQAIAEQAVADAADVEELLMESMIPAMKEIGDRFSRNEAYVPEMLIAARAMQTGLDILEPVLAAKGHEPIAKVAVGTVKGDLHDIGKNLVVIMLKGAGFEVIDVGTDCDVQKFEEAVNDGASAVCCSALLTTTMPYMKEVVEHFATKDDVKILIGGAPVTQAYAEEIGADGFANDANGAVNAVTECLGIAS